jgi:hypothetical protein
MWSADFKHARRATHLLEFLAVKEVSQKLLDARNTSRATDKHNVVDALLLDTGILENLLDGIDGGLENLGVEVFETSTSDLSIEVLAVEQWVNLDSGLCTVGQSSLRTFASRPESSESTSITRQILLRLALELLLEVVEQIGVEILTTQVSITCSSLDSEDTALDVEERDIKGTTTEIVDEDVSLLVWLAGAETIGDSGGGGFIDDTEDIETGDRTSVFGGLTFYKQSDSEPSWVWLLRTVIVEVGRNSDDSLLNLLAELGLSDFFHLREVQHVSGKWSKSFLTLIKTMDDTSCGENCLVSFKYSTCTMGLPPWSMILKGHDSTSFLTVGSSKRRPMSRL